MNAEEYFEKFGVSQVTALCPHYLDIVMAEPVNSNWRDAACPECGSLWWLYAISDEWRRNIVMCDRCKYRDNRKEFIVEGLASAIQAFTKMRE